MAPCPRSASTSNFPQPAKKPEAMTASAEKLDLDHLRQWIGRSTEASDTVTAQLVKGLRATLFQDIGEPKAGDAAPWTTQTTRPSPVRRRASGRKQRWRQGRLACGFAWSRRQFSL